MVALNIMRGFNLYVDEDKNLFLEIEEMKLPKIEDETDEFSPGGSDYTIDVPVGIAKLEAQFKLKGRGPLIRQLSAEKPGKRRRFTAYELIVDEQTGEEVQRVVTMEGRISAADPETSKRKEMVGYDYTLGSITLYEDVHDGDIIHRFNFFTNERTVDGVDLNATSNRLLGIR